MAQVERLNLYIPSELKEWFRQESDEKGVRMSSYISLILSKYKDDIEAQKSLEFLRKQAVAMSTEDMKNSIVLTNAFIASQK